MYTVWTPWCQHFLNYLPTRKKQQTSCKNVGFQLAWKNLDDLALSMVQAHTATISWCHSASFLLNRACTFQFATSPATPYSLLLLFPACFTHFPATQMQLEKGCWHIVGGVGVGEGAEVWVSRHYVRGWHWFKPFFSQQENAFINKLCMELQNLNTTEVKEAMG